MKKLKKMLAIMLVLSLSLSFIACSNTPQNDEDDKDKSSETRKPTPDNSGKSPEPEETINKTSETTKVDETTSVVDSPVLPTVELLSSFVEKYISFDGADGFGKLKMSFKGQDGVMASDGTASITCVGNYENSFTISNGSDNFPAKIVASKTEALTTGDTITFDINYYTGKTASDVGFNVAPFTVTVPELGKYITNSAQITDAIWQKIINPDNWTGQEGSTMRKTAEGALLCYAYPAYLLENSDYETESKYGILLIVKNGSYLSPYAYIFLTDIKTFSDGKVEARAADYDHGSRAYDAYQFFMQDTGKHFDILMGEKHDIEVSTYYPIITPDGRPQVNLFSKFADQFIVSGENGKGILTLPNLGKEGTILHTEPHKDGDLYFIVDNSYREQIRVVQNNRVLARFEWGVDFDSGLDSGDEVYVGMWFTGSNAVSDFDDLPFQYIPTKITVPTLGEVVLDNSIFNSELCSALGSVGEWNTTRIDYISYDNYGYDYRTPDNAKIVKIQLLEVRPSYVLASKFQSKYSILVYFEHEGYYYGLWCFDMIRTPDGKITPKYVAEIDGGYNWYFSTMEYLENAAFGIAIDRDTYIITTIYE